MITGELRNKIDGVWNAFWSGGISNPLEVIEQITNLLFIQRLDHEQRLKERAARVTKVPVKDPIFAPDQEGLRWNEFKTLDPETMYQRVADEVYPFVRRLGGDGSTYSEFMGDARFTIQSPALLDKVVGLLDAVPRDKPDTNGDLYEYLLSKLSTSGVNGQFRTPRHIIDLMVRMTAPQVGDTICDPACGTAGFLVSAAQYVREKYPSVGADAGQRRHFHHHMFHGYDFDSTMLRIGSMNMLQHGIAAPDIRSRDSLSEGANEDTGRYTLILANPPFAGSLDYESTSKDLQQVVRTKKTELLFLALFLRLLEPGGQAAVIVPEGVLFGSSKAHKEIRRVLVEEQKLDAVVKLPSGVFRPYAGVSTAILFFTKTDDGGTDNVWFYDVRADGFSLDDKRNPIQANDLPDVLERWCERTATEHDRARTAQSFVVGKPELVSQGYDLSMNRYREVLVDRVDVRHPLEIITEIEEIEEQIAKGLAALRTELDDHAG